MFELRYPRAFRSNKSARFRDQAPVVVAYSVVNRQSRVCVARDPLASLSNMYQLQDASRWYWQGLSKKAKGCETDCKLLAIARRPRWSVHVEPPSLLDPIPCSLWF